MSGDRDFARELYPFLYASEISDGAPDPALLASVRSSTLAKCAEVIALRTELLLEYDQQMYDAAEAMAERLDRGGKLLAFGNGGSATDADDAAMDCMSPPFRSWRRLPAISLPADSATISALANDVGIQCVFARSLAAIGESNDIALGFSTSGNSENIVAAFVEAKRRSMLTIAFSGHDGGAVARQGAVDFCFVARREFVPRIQEGHATLWHSLLELVQDALVERADAVA